MNIIPSFIACGMSASAFEDDDDNWSLFDFAKDQLFCCRDDSVETIFRPIAAEHSASRDAYLEQMTPWAPPIYRDKTLLSAPSGEEVSNDRYHTGSISSPSNQSSNSKPVNVIPNDPHSPHGSSCQWTVDPTIEKPLPSEFIPPRHIFSRSFESKEPTSCLMDTHSDMPPSLVQLACASANRAAAFSSIALEPNFVVCGRGAPTSIHRGNIAFKRVIKKHEVRYLCSKRSEKPKIALQLLEEFRNSGVRFVKREREEEDGPFIWVEIGDQQAYEKICQSLREGAPQLRREMLATQALQRSSSNSARGDMIHQSISSCSNDTMKNPDWQSHGRNGGEISWLQLENKASCSSPLKLSPSRTICRDARDDHNYSMRHLATSAGWLSSRRG